MKAHKLIACLLVAVLLVQNMVAPAFASSAEEDEESTEVIELYYPVDENGFITSYQPYMPTELGLGSILIGASSTSSFVGGLVAVSAPAVGTLAVLLLQAGIVVGSIALLAQVAELIYEALPQETKDLLNGLQPGEIIPSDVLNQFNEVVASRYAQDDGTFSGTELTFPVTSFLQYDFDAQNVSGEQNLADCFIYPASFQPVEINNTTLTMQLVQSMYSYGYYDILFTNTETGAKMRWYNSSLSRLHTDSDQFDHCEITFSTPTIRTHMTDSGFIYHEVGIWYLLRCSVREAGNTCYYHSKVYQSHYLSELTLGDNDSHIKLSGTGTKFDDTIVKSVTVMDTYLQYLPYNLSGTATTFQTTYTSLAESFCSYPATVTFDENPAIPLDSVIPVPTTEELTDITTLVTDTPTDIPNTSDLDMDFISNLISLIKQIFSGLVALLSGFFADASNAIGSLFDYFTSGIKVYFDQMGEGYIAFFEFMRNLWACFPVVIRGLLGSILLFVVLFGLLKMFV